MRTSAKQRAIVACWKWAQENAPFEPDWCNFIQEKYYVVFSDSGKRITAICCHHCQYQFTLPYFKSKEDCESFIKANKEHLELLFNK